MSYQKKYSLALDALTMAIQAERKAAALEGHVAELNSQCASLKSRWKKEERDVEKFENLTLSSFIASITGQIDTKLRKEQQEALEAKMAYDSAMYALEQAKSDLQYYMNESANVEQMKRKVDRLFSEIFKYVSENDPESGPKLREMDVSIQQNKEELREIAEALSVGLELDAQLEDLLRVLDSAQNWGVFDLVAGGMISSAIKHDRLEQAKRRIDQCMYTLQRFNKELADVGQTVRSDLDFDGFSRFVDIFLDNFFFDWFVQDKIVKVIDQTKELSRKLHTSMESLRLERNRLEKENMALQTAQENLLKQVNVPSIRSSKDKGEIRT